MNLNYSKGPFKRVFSIILASFLLSSIALINSCKDDEIDTQPNDNSSDETTHQIPPRAKYKGHKSAFPSLSVDGNGVLVFNDLAQFQDFFIWAEQEIEAYESDFIDDFPGLTGDTLADSLFYAGFDSYAPLRAFEDLYPNFNSMRQKIETDMQPFL